ncbi:MAG: undecaprenyldiphospho-muramoylpentapeptide beta-N-acetylglucosaminyltransferase [Pseudomonadota bacterium]
MTGAAAGTDGEGKDKLVVLAAGGTGGHMFPAEALGAEMKRRGWRVLLVTDKRGLRYAANFPADEILEISAATPNVRGQIAKVVAALSIAGGLITSMIRFRKDRPAVAVGFGGYPSLPAMKGAALMKIPYGVHEQNGVLGRANRLLVKEAAFMAHAFPQLDKAPAGVQGIEVGNPVRDAVLKAAAAPYAAIAPDGEIRLLIFGGSQGASILTETPARAIAGLPEALRRRLRVTHQARDEGADTVKAIYEKAGVHADIAAFFDDLPQHIAEAHLVISRAGASTVTELAIIGRPSVLAPLAIAMDDHQTGNAKALSSHGGAIIAPEDAFTEKALIDILQPLLEAPARLEEMAAAAKDRVKTNAATSLADLVEEAAFPAAA